MQSEVLPITGSPSTILPGIVKSKKTQKRKIKKMKTKCERTTPQERALSYLGENIQRQTTEAITQLIGDLSGFIAVFQFKNMAYSQLTPTELKNSAKMQEFIVACKDQQLEQTALVKRINTYSKIIPERLRALQDGCNCWQLEIDLSKHSYVGYDSAVGGIVYQRYGINYRFRLVEEEIHRRAKGLLLEESAVENSSNQAIEPVVFPELLDIAYTMVERFAELKEELLVFTEVLKAFTSTDLPKKYYLLFSQEYKEIKTRVEENRRNIENHLKEVTDKILSVTDQISKAKLEQEQKNFKYSLERIDTRLREIENLLTAYASFYAIKESNDTSVVDEVSDEVLPNAAMSLLKDIVGFKEDMGPGPNWDALNYLQKKAQYDKEISYFNDLKRRKEELESNKFDGIEQQITDCKIYMLRLSEHLKLIQEKASELAQENTRRKTWKIYQLPPEEEPPTNPATNLLSLNPLKWFSTSSSN